MNKLPRLFLFLFLVVFNGHFAFAQNTVFFISQDSVQKIVIADHQDLGREAFYGSRYEILNEDGKFNLYRLKQYFYLDTENTFTDIDLEQSNERQWVRQLSPQEIFHLFNAINDTLAYSLHLSEFPELELSKAVFLEEINKVTGKELNDAQQELFYKLWEDPRMNERLLKQMFNQQWTGDNPMVALQIITHTDTMEVFSKEQEAYMLPWNMNRMGSSYNPDISRAIAEILPDLNYSNKSRLEGSSFIPDLAFLFYEDFFKAEDIYRQAIEQYAEALAILAPLELIGRYEFSRRDRIDYRGHHLAGQFNHPDLPRNILVEAKFPIIQQTATGIDSFAAVYNRLDDRIKKAEWLFNYLVTHPEVNATVNILGGSAFAARAQDFFIGETKRFVYNEDLLGQLHSGILLYIEETPTQYSRWLILPDGRTILWHFRGKSVLHIPEEELQPTKIQENALKTIGKFINAEGVVE